MYKDIVIIGAGTAGLTAALYAARAGKDVMLVEDKLYGGQIINAAKIENYPGILSISGYDFAVNLYNQVMKTGVLYNDVSIKSISVMDGDTKVEAMDKNTGRYRYKILIGDKEYYTKSIIIATGSRKRRLGVPLEEDFIGKGVSYCATCDGAFFKNREVAIVGGGNEALGDAIFLSNYCKKVYVIHRRDAFRGEETSIKTLGGKDNVQFVMSTTVVKLVGDDELTGIEIEHSNDNTKEVLQVEGLFIAVGQEPDTSLFKDLVKLDDKGYVIAGEDCKTSREGIFVAGDVRTKEVRQLVTAAADGAVAALGAVKFI